MRQTRRGDKQKISSSPAAHFMHLFEHLHPHIFSAKDLKYCRSVYLFCCSKCSHVIGLEGYEVWSQPRRSGADHVCPEWYGRID